MAEKQVKGILKNAKYSEQPPTKPTETEDGVKWDEMNIIATHHPPDKDYGHMKINEPNTPYNAMIEPDDDEDENPIDHEDLTTKLEAKGDKKWWEKGEGEEESSGEEEVELTEEQKEEREKFELKRKQHYNEFSNMKLAKKLIEQELQDLEDSDEEDEAEETKASTSMQLESDAVEESRTRQEGDNADEIQL